MDYKTTTLNKEAKITEEILPEMNGLFFGEVGRNQAVFDYTAYIEHNGLDLIDHKTFMRANKRYIEFLAKSKGRKTSELFYQNTNGHILVAAELVFLFLSFANPEMCVYFNGLIGDVIASGAAYSDGFVYSAAAERLPTEVLAEIIKNRMANEEGNEQQSDSDSGL